MFCIIVTTFKEHYIVMSFTQTKMLHKMSNIYIKLKRIQITQNRFLKKKKKIITFSYLWLYLFGKIVKPLRFFSL